VAESLAEFLRCDPKKPVPVCPDIGCPQAVATCQKAIEAFSFIESRPSQIDQADHISCVTGPRDDYATIGMAD